ncbi:MAG TPA: hypothetical protein VIV40_19910 [Kofleriaceae bacterium]
MHARMTCEVRGNHLTLAGAIDENANLVRMLDHAKDQRLTLDLGGITFINSLGIRGWIRMQQAAAGAHIRLELLRVAEPLIHQLNIMPAARGVSIVTSFFAPYVCDDCDQEHPMLLDVRMHGADLAKQRAPLMKCPDCDSEMDFADPPDLYFMFLAG